jgi:hypothetical protein
MDTGRAGLFLLACVPFKPQPMESTMAEVKPMTTQTLDPNAPAPSPPHPVAASPAAPAPVDPAAMAAKVYDLRKTADPLVFERVTAFHPHAATSQEAFDTFKADLDRLGAEAKTKADDAAKAKADADAEAKAKADAAKPAPAPAKPAP